MTGKRSAQTTESASSTAVDDTTAPLQFGVRNAVLGLLGLLALVGGYVLLGQGSISAAPLLLVVGYIVLLPAAILS